MEDSVFSTRVKNAFINIETINGETRTIVISDNEKSNITISVNRNIIPYNKFLAFDERSLNVEFRCVTKDLEII